MGKFAVNVSKYANEMTDDVIHSTKYYIKYINSAIFVNLQQRPLKLGRLIVLNATHPQPDFNILVVLSLEDIKQGHELNQTYLSACWIMQMTHHWQ